MKFVYLIPYLFLIACGGPETAIVYNQSKFDTTAILNDLENKDGEFFLSDYKHYSMKIVIKDTESFEETDKETITLGSAYRSFITDDCEIKLHSLLDQESLNVILRHEIGHCFGLDHVANPSAVMNALYTPDEVTANSLIEFSNELRKVRNE